MRQAHRNKKVSVVVPVYNGAKYLPDLIKNLSAQTYHDFEVLLVDDFSTDNSVDIIHAAAERDPRFKLLRRTTKGGTAVAGQEYALPFVTGGYYFYMSQDDLIDNDLLGKCVERAIETGADVVMPNMVFYYADKENTKALQYPLNNDYNSELSPKAAFELSLDWQIHGFVLKKTALVKKVGIKAEYYNSCEFYGRKSLLAANKVVFVDTNFYYRQDNPDAITKTVKYFTVDVMTTDLMLLDIAIQNRCGRETIRRRIRYLRGAFTWWAKNIKSAEWTETQRQYVKSACRNAFKKLFRLSLIYNVHNKPHTFIIRGIKCL